MNGYHTQKLYFESSNQILHIQSSKGGVFRLQNTPAQWPWEQKPSDQWFPGNRTLNLEHCR